jgi:hypothetical protein
MAKCVRAIQNSGSRLQPAAGSNRFSIDFPMQKIRGKRLKFLRALLSGKGLRMPVQQGKQRIA